MTENIATRVRDLLREVVPAHHVVHRISEGADERLAAGAQRA